MSSKQFANELHQWLLLLRKCIPPRVGGQRSPSAARHKTTNRLVAPSRSFVHLTNSVTLRSARSASANGNSATLLLDKSTTVAGAAVADDAARVRAPKIRHQHRIVLPRVSAASIPATAATRAAPVAHRP